MRSEQGAGPNRQRRSLLKRLAATGITFGVTSRGAHAESLRTGRLAPPATLVALDGRRYSTPDLLGHVVILTFWATWCAPCLGELLALSDYVGRYSARGLLALAFCLDGPERMSEVQRIAQPLLFPVGLMSASRAPGYGRIWRLPVSFTIDRQGILVGNGWQDSQPVLTEERLETSVTPLLGAAY